MIDEDDIKGNSAATLGEIGGIVTFCLLIFVGCMVYFFPA